MVLEGVMTKLEQESHSKHLSTAADLVTRTRACVVLCLYSLLFCLTPLNTLFPSLLIFSFFALLLLLSIGFLT